MAAASLTTPPNEQQGLTCWLGRARQGLQLEKLLHPSARFAGQELCIAHNARSCCALRPAWPLPPPGASSCSPSPAQQPPCRPAKKAVVRRRGEGAAVWRTGGAGWWQQASIAQPSWESLKPVLTVHTPTHTCPHTSRAPHLPELENGQGLDPNLICHGVNPPTHTSPHIPWNLTLKHSKAGRALTPSSTARASCSVIHTPHFHHTIPHTFLLCLTLKNLKAGSALTPSSPARDSRLSWVVSNLTKCCGRGLKGKDNTQGNTLQVLGYKRAIKGL